MTDQRLEVEVLDLKRRVAALEHPEPRKPREWTIPIGVGVSIYPNGTVSVANSMMVGCLTEYVKVREVIE